MTKKRETDFQVLIKDICQRGWNVDKINGAVGAKVPLQTGEW